MPGIKTFLRIKPCKEVGVASSVRRWLAAALTWVGCRTGVAVV
jgi:hypothetical protein